VTAEPAARPWRAVVVADLHLTPRDATGLARMVALLRLATERARKVWLLGDVFDLWLTGDERALPEFAELFAAFRAARAAGVEVAFLPGNRDFNLTRDEGAAIGIDVVGGEEVDATLAGRRVRLLHGDQLLTDDRGYQLLKRVLRSGLFLWLAKHLPTKVVFWIGRRIRSYSDRHVPGKRAYVLRIVPAAVAARIAAGATQVICGHVHHLDRRIVAGGGELLVLPPFCDDGEFVVDADGPGGAALWLGRPDGSLAPLPPPAEAPLA